MMPVICGSKLCDRMNRQDEFLALTKRHVDGIGTWCVCLIFLKECVIMGISYNFVGLTAWLTNA